VQLHSESRGYQADPQRSEIGGKVLFGPPSGTRNPPVGQFVKRAILETLQGLGPFRDAQLFVSEHLVIAGKCHCGTTTHWIHTRPEENNQIAMYLQLAELDVIDSIPSRQFGGADSWSFID
jgi:hypothetical protein